MTQGKKFRLTMIAVAVAATAASHAQESGGALDKVTITATKREAVLTDVSLAVSTVSGKALEERGITSLEELSVSATGMNIIKTSPGDNLIVSRGISTSQSMSIQSGPAVGVYVDEMPWVGLTSGVPDFGLWDVSRVEMLRGPQGTLYGEGAMAGTIRIISAAPNTEKFSSKFQLTGESVANGATGSSVRGMLNVPLSQGVAALRATVAYVNDPGWIDAPELNKTDVNGRKQTPDLIPFRRTLLHELTAYTMNGLNVLLLDGFNSNKTHSRSCHCFANCLSIIRIVFIAFNIRLYKLGCHQLDGMPHFL